MYHEKTKLNQQEDCMSNIELKYQIHDPSQYYKFDE